MEIWLSSSELKIEKSPWNMDEVVEVLKRNGSLNTILSELHTSRKNPFCNLSKATKSVICDYFGQQNWPK
jgi:hypothetical protein